MATRKSQRIGIWIIAGAMILGTVGGFIAMMVAPANEAKDKAALDEALAVYQKRQDERQKKVDAQSAELSEKYYAEFSSYASRVGEFDAGAVNELQKEDLKAGDGEEIKDDTGFSYYYILWLPDGNIKEQSAVDGKLSQPGNVSMGLANADLIQGWKEGLIGMKVGGVRELTIPSSKGYGDKDKTNQDGSVGIPANTPLKFIVMAIPTPAEILAAEVPELVKKEMERLYGASF